MELFKTNNLETVTYCRTQFNFYLPSTAAKRSFHRAANAVFGKIGGRSPARRYKLCKNVFCTVVLNDV